MILILGSSGYLGSAVIDYFLEKDVHFFQLHKWRFNYYDFHELYNFVEQNNVKMIVNCAGYTGTPNIASCEKNKKECYTANVDLPTTLAKVCEFADIELLHISSGDIYDGYDKIYDETDVPNFCREGQANYYSFTKALGENRVKGIMEDNYYILRPKALFDHFYHTQNYIFKLLKYNKILNLKNCLTNRQDLARIISEFVVKKPSYGVYNIVNSGHIKPERIIALAKEKYNFNNDFKIFNTSKDFYGSGTSIVPRSNCLLSNSKLLSEGFKLKDLNTSMEEAFAELRIK